MTNFGTIPHPWTGLPIHGTNIVRHILSTKIDNLSLTNLAPGQDRTHFEGSALRTLDPSSWENWTEETVQGICGRSVGRNIDASIPRILLRNNGPPAREVRLNLSVVGGAGGVEEEGEAAVVAYAPAMHARQQCKSQLESQGSRDSPTGEDVSTRRDVESAFGFCGGDALVVDQGAAFDDVGPGGGVVCDSVVDELDSQ